MNFIQRIISRIARLFGLWVIDTETLLRWTKLATEHIEEAAKHDLENKRLSGLHDGHARAYNACAREVLEINL